MVPKSDCSQQNVLETSQQILWRQYSENKKNPFGLVFKIQPELWKEGKENKGNKGIKEATSKEDKKEKKKKKRKNNRIKRGKKSSGGEKKVF